MKVFKYGDVMNNEKFNLINALILGAMLFNFFGGITGIVYTSIGMGNTAIGLFAIFIVLQLFFCMFNVVDENNNHSQEEI